MHRALAVVLAACGTAALISLIGCVSHDYVGETFTPTNHVQVFYDQSAVPAGYEVIGQDRAETLDGVETRVIVQDMVKKAQQVGADAIVITGVDTVVTGSATSTPGKSGDDVEYYATTDGQLHTRNKSSSTWRANSYSTTQRDKVVTARFLKRR